MTSCCSNTSKRGNKTDLDVTRASPMMRKRMVISSDNNDVSHVCDTTTTAETTTSLFEHFFCGATICGNDVVQEQQHDDDDDDDDDDPSKQANMNQMHDCVKTNTSMAKIMEQEQRRRDIFQKSSGTMTTADWTVPTVSSMIDSCSSSVETPSICGEEEMEEEVVEVHIQTSSMDVVPRQVSVTVGAVEGEDRRDDTDDHDEDDDDDVEMKAPRILCGDECGAATAFPSPEVQDCYADYRLKNEFVEDVLKNLDVTTPLFFGRKKVVNVVSEPMASAIKVRGPTYNTSGIKTYSSPSLFALLGMDNLLRPKHLSPLSTLHCCKWPNSYFSRLKRACERANVATPFLLVINFNLPWGNIISYHYRPNATNDTPWNENVRNDPSEQLWKLFLQWDEEKRNQRLKLIPKIGAGPWVVKKLVGKQPVIVGQKLPVRYYGSVEERYLEICMDVTQGNQLGNTIATTMAGKSESVTVDLAFVVEGKEVEELPEKVLCGFRLHHLDLNSLGVEEWRMEVERRESVRAERRRRS